MTRQEQQQRRLEQAIAHVWIYELETLARLPRRIRDREALRRARALAHSGKRIAWNPAKAGSCLGILPQKPIDRA